MNRQNPGIEYCDWTWNPIKMRCTKVDTSCDNCWHLAAKDRFAAENPLNSLNPPYLDEKELQAPLKLRKPSTIAVQFMGDLFHEDVTFSFIRRIRDVALACKNHTFLFLTKRPGRMSVFFDMQNRLQPEIRWENYTNLHLGVSVHDQKTADERIPILRQILAANRWISYEPALEEVDFEPFLQYDPFHNNFKMTFDANDFTGPDWIVMGAESLPGNKYKNARPMKLEWARNVRDQCKEAGVPFFMKQVSGRGKIPDDLNIKEYPNV